MAQKKSEKFFWNLYAFCYDAISHLIPYQEMMADVTEAIDLKPGERLLDAGCGTGNLELAVWKDFQRKYPGQKVRIDAVDFSESMLSRAIKKCENIHEISFRWMDLNEPLPYPDEIFDKIVSVNVLYALNAENIIFQFNRVLKPNGKIILATPSPDFKQTEILKGHLRKISKPIDYVKISSVFPLIFTVGILNIFFIERWEKQGSFCSFGPFELMEILKRYNFDNKNVETTYSNQDFLIVAKKIKGEVS
jgi:ubiquinone/menaquinone biosynthesis C-methylase UbiE